MWGGLLGENLTVICASDWTEHTRNGHGIRFSVGEFLSKGCFSISESCFHKPL